MRSRANRRLVALITLGVLSLLMLSGSAAGATTGPNWTATQPYGTAVTDAPSFDSVACASATSCVAAGMTPQLYGPNSARLAVESDGVWGADVQPQLPSDGIPAAPSALTSVSCTNAGSCEAVGSYYSKSGNQAGMVVSITPSGTSATTSAVALPLPAGTGLGIVAYPTGISCAATCTVVGYLYGVNPFAAFVSQQSSSGAWTTSLVSAPTVAPGSGLTVQASFLNAVSCPSSGPCEAVGDWLDSSYKLHPMAVQISNGVAGIPQTVALPADAQLVGLGYAPTLLYGTYLPSGATGADVGLNSVSCPSAGVCTAAGNYVNASSDFSPVVVPISGGTPGTAVELADPSGHGASGNPGYLPAGISCTDASDCTLAATQLLPGTSTPSFAAVVSSEVSGHWSAFSALTSTISGTEPVITGLGCTPLGSCVVAGEGIAPSGAPNFTAFFAYGATPIAITTASLPQATVGVPYSATLQASGGGGPISWSAGPGALPAGLSLNPFTGVISGIPTAAGQDGFVVNASAAGLLPLTGTAGLSITVNPAPVVTPASSAAPVSSTPAATPATASVRIAYTHTRGGQLLLVLSCNDATCAGNLAATGIEHINTKHGKHGKHSRINAHGKRKHPRTRVITLLHGHYTLAAGATEVIHLKLNHNAMALLRKLHHLTATLKLTPTGQHNPAVIHRLKFSNTTNTKKHKR